MTTYPMRIPRQTYGGRDPRKLDKARNYDRAVARIEGHPNAELAKLPDDTIRVFLSADIARELQEDLDLVYEIIFSIDCGHNGVTLCKGDFERAVPRPQQGASCGTMTVTLPPNLREKVARLAAERGITIEDFVVKTISERVEWAEFIRERFGTSKPGELTELIRSGPNRPPFPGDELPPDLAERMAAQRRARSNEE